MVDAAVAILSVQSGQGSLVGMERVAKRHRQTLNELHGTDVGKSPSDFTFRPLLAQLVTLVCAGKTLRGSIAQTALPPRTHF